MNYATVWNFDSPGYTKLRGGETIFGGEVAPTTSNYFIGYSYFNKSPAAICTDSSYVITPKIGSKLIVKGIITTDSFGYVVFYPYYSDVGDNLFIICERNEDSEKYYESHTHLALPDGTEARVQPIEMYLALANGGEDGGRYFPSIDEICAESSNFIEAEITFDSISVSASGVNSDEPVIEPSALGEFFSYDDINILRVY